MTRKFIYLQKFSEKWNKLNLTEDDLVPLEEYLLGNPKAGVAVKGTDGLRKLRWKLPNIGKRGGIRIAYIDVVISEKVYMLDLFPKGEKDNYTNAEINILKNLVNELKKESKRGK